MAIIGVSIMTSALFALFFVLDSCLERLWCGGDRSVGLSV
jgi:hypothetical protein